MKLLFLFLFMINIYSKIYKLTILHTKIYKLFNFHNLVLLENNINKDTYLIDFVPEVDITNPINIIKLISNQNGKGKIYIYSYESLDEHQHKRKIKQINDKINDENINDIINKFNTSFNLYNNNCTQVFL
jgi:hypothetical protein